MISIICEEHSRSEIQYILYCWHLWMATAYAEDSQVGWYTAETLHYTQFMLSSFIEFKGLTPPIHACMHSS